MDEMKIVELVARMTDEEQKIFYNGLLKKGFSKDEIITIQKMVFFQKMYTNTMFYKSVQNVVGMQFYENVNNSR